MITARLIDGGKVIPFKVNKDRLKFKQAVSSLLPFCRCNITKGRATTALPFVSNA